MNEIFICHFTQMTLKYTKDSTRTNMNVANIVYVSGNIWNLTCSFTATAWKTLNIFNQRLIFFFLQLRHFKRRSSLVGAIKPKTDDLVLNEMDLRCSFGRAAARRKNVSASMCSIWPFINDGQVVVRVKVGTRREGMCTKTTWCGNIGLLVHRDLLFKLGCLSTTANGTTWPWQQTHTSITPHATSNLHLWTSRYFNFWLGPDLEPFLNRHLKHGGYLVPTANRSERTGGLWWWR